MQVRTLNPKPCTLNPAPSIVSIVTIVYRSSVLRVRCRCLYKIIITINKKIK